MINPLGVARVPTRGCACSHARSRRQDRHRTRCHFLSMQRATPPPSERHQLNRTVRAYPFRYAPRRVPPTLRDRADEQPHPPSCPSILLSQRCAHRAFGWSAEPSLRSELERNIRAAGLRPRRSCAPAHAAKGTFASCSVLGLKPDSELVDVTQAFGRGVSKGHTYHYRVNP